MTKSVTPFLMYEGAAEEAVNLYVSLFQKSSIQSIERWQAGEPGAEGCIKQCHFTVAGLSLRCFDSPVKHGFTFTPSWSLFVEFDNETELDAVFTKLSEGGKVLMPPGNYGFSSKFAWLNDRFGVSWQLNFA